MPQPFRRGRVDLAASRLAFSWASALLVGVVLLFLPGTAHAYPWMIRHGYTNCGACHTDPSGGELLTLYGHGISYEVLSTRFGGSEKSAARDERRFADALSHAAGSKSAPPKKKAAAEEKIDLDAETPAAKAEPDADKAEAATAEEEPEAPPKKKPSDEEEEEATEEDSGEEDAGAGDASQGDAEKFAPTASQASQESSPFQGMMPITGPLFGLLGPNENFLLGGSLRFATLYKFDANTDKFRFFPMQADVYGQVRFAKIIRVAGSLGIAKVKPGSPNAHAAQVTTNQGYEYNLLSRTYWVGAEFGEGAHLVRAGRLNLPFGVRIPEHTMWVREQTQTDRESDQQVGVALFMGFDALRFEIMGIAGNYQVNPDAFRERGYSAYGEYVVDPKVALGLSSLITYAKDDRLAPTGQPVTRQAHGAFLRAAPAEAVSILVEADALLRSRRGFGYVGYLQVDVEPVQGFHVTGTGEIYDAGLVKDGSGAPRSAGAGRPQPGGWFSLQWFFLPHFDMRVDVIKRQDAQLLSQLHVYL